jgi:hypothetical protein
MKKVVFWAIVLLAMTVMQACVLAATKQDLYNLLNDPYWEARGSYLEPYRANTRDFLNTNSFTQAEIDGMYQDALNIRQTWINTGEYNLAAMSLSDQERLRDMAIAAAARVGATMTATPSENGWNVTVSSRTGRSYTFVNLGTNVGDAWYADPTTGSVRYQGSSSSGTPSIDTGSVGNPIRATGVMMDFRPLYGLIIIMSFGLLSLVGVFYWMNRKYNLLTASAA